MSNPVSPHEVLGLDQSASKVEIKSRYRLLARKYHPDVNNGDRTALWVFRQIDTAYKNLNGQPRAKPPDLDERVRRAKQRAAEETSYRYNSPPLHPGNMPYAAVAVVSMVLGGFVGAMTGSPLVGGLCVIVLAVSIEKLLDIVL